jgi:hypothetical protein
MPEEKIEDIKNIIQIGNFSLNEKLIEDKGEDIFKDKLILYYAIKNTLYFDNFKYIIDKFKKFVNKKYYNEYFNDDIIIFLLKDDTYTNKGAHINKTMYINERKDRLENFLSIFDSDDEKKKIINSKTLLDYIKITSNKRIIEILIKNGLNIKIDENQKQSIKNFIENEKDYNEYISGLIVPKPETTTAADGKSKKRKKRRRSKRSKRCKSLLGKKIGINIHEGIYANKAQAIAVAYSQVRKRHPSCRRILSKKKSKKSKRRF